MKGSLDCEKCQDINDARARAVMHCGLMRRDEWGRWDMLQAGRATMERDGYVVDITEGDTCPFWFRTQPAVHQGSLAARAFDKGQLVTFFPGNQQVINEAALVCMGAWDEFQACEMEDLKRKG